MQGGAFSERQKRLFNFDANNVKIKEAQITCKLCCAIIQLAQIINVASVYAHFRSCSHPLFRLKQTRAHLPRPRCSGRILSRRKAASVCLLNPAAFCGGAQ